MEPTIGQSLNDLGECSLQMSGNENGFFAADMAKSMNIAMPSPNAELQYQFHCAGVGYEAPQQAGSPDLSMKTVFKPDGLGLS